MERNQEERKPTLTPIKNGWAAHGDGWAIHASTREEAIQKFREAEHRHQEIDKLPFWYERFRAHSTDRDNHVQW